MSDTSKLDPCQDMPAAGRQVLVVASDPAVPTLHGQVIGENDGMVVVFVAGGIEQRDASPLLEERLQLDNRGVVRQLGPVPLLEAFPALGSMAKPLPQDRARCDILQPEIDLRFILLDPARPHAVNQDAQSIGLLRRVVNPFNSDGHDASR